MTSPLVVNFGGGVDSTAILVGLARLHRAGIEGNRPDLVLFADTGDELPETYANVERVSRWCQFVGFPAVTVVRRQDFIEARTPDTSLSERCIRNETLPSEAFGRGSCSIVWKHDAMNGYLRGKKRPHRDGWLKANGYGKPTKLIGYDAGEAAKGKRGKWAKVTETTEAHFRYPLVEWGWTREDCIEAIRREGLPVPVKSACFMCPNQSEGELRTMATDNPELLLRALAIEEIAKRGKHGLRKIEGLWRRTRKADGRSGSWTTWARSEGILAQVEGRVGQTLEQLIAQLKPALSNPLDAAGQVG